MFSHDTRAQVLANLKFLYGPDVEVITLNVGTLGKEECQAVAMKFNPLNNATWTKYLHGEPSSTSTFATLNLLRKSEMELTKIFSANGNMVPFEGDTAQALTIGRGQQSDFVFVDIAEPTLPDTTVPKDLIEEDSSVQAYSILETPVEEESPIQEYPVPEIPAEEAVLEPVGEAPKTFTLEPGRFCDEPEPASGEAETHDSGWVSWGTSKMGRQKQKAVLTFDLPSLVEDYPAEASVEEPPAEVEACPIECIVEPSPPPEPEPNENIVEENPVPEPEPTDETYLEGDAFSLKKSKKREKKSSQEFWEKFDEPIIEVEPPPVHEPAVEDAWGAMRFTAKNSKKKKGGPTFESVDPVAEAPPPPFEPEPVIEGTWGTSWGAIAKKSKKKKAGSIFESVDPVAEAPPPPFEPEPVIEDIWGTGWGAIAKKNKKKKAGFIFESVDQVAEAPPSPSEPEPVIEDTWFGWGTTNKKSKKIKGKSLEVPSDPAPEPKPKPEPVVVNVLETPTEKEENMRDVLKPEPDECAQFSASERSEKDQMGVAEMPLGEESSATKESSVGMVEVPPASEPVRHSDVAILLPQATSTETATHTIQPSARKSGQTVVFTIQFPEEISMKPLQAMITLADNTRAAIIEAVYSYIDTKSSLMFTQGRRRLEIRCGAGKNGDIDLSTLEEMMWPEYLEYFRQYTKLPELTVDCLHC